MYGNTKNNHIWLMTEYKRHRMQYEIYKIIALSKKQLFFELCFGGFK